MFPNLPAVEVSQGVSFAFCSRLQLQSRGTYVCSRRGDFRAILFEAGCSLQWVPVARLYTVTPIRSYREPSDFNVSGLLGVFFCSWADQPREGGGAPASFWSPTGGSRTSFNSMVSSSS